MHIKRVIQKRCLNPLVCMDDMIKVMEEKNVGLILTGATPNGHLSISHEQDSHIIWLFAYDQDKKHESVINDKLIITHSDKVKKYDGLPITQ